MQPESKIRKFRTEGARRDGKRTPQAKARTRQRRAQRAMKRGGR